MNKDWNLKSFHVICFVGWRKLRLKWIKSDCWRIGETRGMTRLFWNPGLNPPSRRFTRVIMMEKTRDEWLWVDKSHHYRQTVLCVKHVKGTTPKVLRKRSHTMQGSNKTNSFPLLNGAPLMTLLMNIAILFKMEVMHLYSSLIHHSRLQDGIIFISPV